MSRFLMRDRYGEQSIGHDLSAFENDILDEMTCGPRIRDLNKSINQLKACKEQARVRAALDGPEGDLSIEEQRL